jgi:CheY-like chemotaxis protein
MHKTIEADFFPQAVESIKDKPCIMIVDDNRDFTRAAKIGLENTGRYCVWEENEPARAHQTARQLKPGLVLLDIAMPEADGGEVAARIDADPTLQRTPIVFLTGLVTKAEARSGLQIQDIGFSASRSVFQSWSQALNKSACARAGKHLVIRVSTVATSRERNCLLMAVLPKSDSILVIHRRRNAHDLPAGDTFEWRFEKKRPTTFVPNGRYFGSISKEGARPTSRVVLKNPTYAKWQQSDQCRSFA